MAQMVKNLPAVQETWVRSLGWEESLENGLAICLPGESLEGYSPWGTLCFCLGSILFSGSAPLPDPVQRSVVEYATLKYATSA